LLTSIRSLRLISREPAIANAVNPSGLSPYFSPVTGAVSFLPGNFQGGSDAGWSDRLQLPDLLELPVGVEADIQGTSMRTGGNNNFILYPNPATAGLASPTPLASGGNPGIALNWFGTVHGRLGYLITPTLLLYGLCLAKMPRYPPERPLGSRANRRLRHPRPRGYSLALL
jgi:hypothetical protein